MPAARAHGRLHRLQSKRSKCRQGRATTRLALDVSPIRSARRWNILTCRQSEALVVGIYRRITNPFLRVLLEQEDT
eukprot:671938-Pyramimonas_sp.AAC.1